ncbi:MAG: hypothetical protein LBJ83_03070 [Oscillospiraceae bacterium]|jgi:cytochrome c biogenesis protein CcdA|nr:hypothetical protein [Oscillospiraceae bacterium]
MKTKTKNIIELLSLTGVIVACIVSSTIYNITSETAIYKYERAVEPAGDENFYMIKNNTYTSEIFQFNTAGIILKEHIELTKLPLSTKNTTFLNVMSSNGPYIYFFRNHCSVKTNLIEQVDIVRLEDNGTTLATKDIYKVTGKDLPQVCDAHVENGIIYVVSLWSDKKTIQLETFNIDDDGDLTLKSTKKYMLSNKAIINHAIFINQSIAAVSTIGEVYLLNDSSEQLIYPQTERTQSLVDFITPNLSELVFSNSEHETVFRYNTLSGENTSTNMEDLMHTNKLRPYDILYINLNNSKNYTAIATPSTYDKVSIYFWSNSIPQNISKFKIPLNIALAKSKYFILGFSTITIAVCLIYKGIGFLIYKKRQIVFQFIRIIATFVAGILILLGISEYYELYSSLHSSKQRLAYELGKQLLTTIAPENVANLGETRSSYSENYDQLLQHSELANMQSNIADKQESSNYYSQIFIIGRKEDPVLGDLLVGPSSYNAFLSPIENIYSAEDCNCFYNILKTGEIYSGDMTNDFGTWVVCAQPIKLQTGKIVGILVTMVDIDTLTFETILNMAAYFIIAAASFTILVVLIFFFFKKVLKPLTNLEAAFKEISNENYNVRLLSGTNDEFASIDRTFNKMCEAISDSSQRLQQIKDNYDKFVSEVVHKQFSGKNIDDINVGDFLESDSIFVLQSVGNLFETNLSKQFVKANSNHAINFLNQLFETANGCATRNGGSVLANNLSLGILRTLFESEKEQGALDYSLDVLGEIKTNIPELTHLDFVTLIHKDRTVFGIVGDKNNAFPVINSKDTTRLTKALPKLRELKVQTIVTGTLVEEAKKKYNVRYIGFSGTPGVEKRIDFFEVLDAYNSNEKNKKIATQRTFEKGIDLFYAGDFYEARATFSKVLQENEKDKVAKWYLFMCDKFYTEPNSNISYELL